MPIIGRQRQEENRVKRSGEQHSKNSVKVAAFQMKKANIRTKDICEQLGVPKRTFCDWVRQAKDAGTWSDNPGRVLRPAPRTKAPGTVTMNTKITKMKRLVTANPFLTAKEIKSKVTTHLAGQWAGPVSQAEVAGCWEASNR